MLITSQGPVWWRQVAVLLFGWGLMLLVWPAMAEVDLLSLPAMKSEKAAEAIMLAAERAGKRVVVAGERGIILYSDDDGWSWSQADVPVSVTLTALHFLNEHSGCAVGHDGVVLHSDDGGRTWNKQVDGYRLNEILRADAEELVRQARSRIEAIGGETEDSRQSLEQAEFILDDVTAGAQFGPSRPLLGVWFDNASDGYVVGANGQIFLTQDGGGIWMSAARMMNNPEALHYNAIVAAEGGSKFLAGEGGRVYLGHKDGTWQTFDTGYSGALYGVLPLQDGTGAEVLLAYGVGAAHGPRRGIAAGAGRLADRKRRRWPDIHAEALQPGNAGGGDGEAGGRARTARGWHRRAASDRPWCRQNRI